MINLQFTDGLLNKAFDLACFIQRDREAAVRIITSALGKLEVICAAQGKRLYYRPTGRSWSLRSQTKRLRNRISFNELHLLQRLIYIESEPYEIAQEMERGPAGVGEDELLIHFIKHLIRKSIKRNSFYVTLGLSRLLHSYTTAEAMDIYNAVIQDPERVKDDYYFRSRKGALMQELKLRFGDLIRVCRGPRGEERFEADDNPGRFVQLVQDCLSVFTPWNTPCLVPAGVDPIREGIPSFSYHGHNKEDEVEVNRIHAVLHPDCFRRLIGDLRFDAPENRLNVPRFFYSNDNRGDRSNGHRHATILGEEELSSIKRELEINSARRKVSHEGVLRVIVDGTERGRFDLSETRSLHLHVNSDAELIEVRSNDKTGAEVILAAHPLGYGEIVDGVQSENASITLEGGQKISIGVSPDDTGATVDISYRETNPFLAASLFFHRLTRSIDGGSSQRVWNGRRILVPALAVLLLAVGLAAIFEYGRKANAPGEQNQTATTQPTSTSSGNESSASGNAATEKNKFSNAEKTAKQRETIGSTPGVKSTTGSSSQPGTETATAQETATESRGDTRSLKGRSTAVPLSEVKKIYIEIIGDDPSTVSMRKALVDNLGSGNLIKVVSNRVDADALLEVSVSKNAGRGSEAIEVVVELLNARGQAIWPDANSSGKYEGSAHDVTAKVVRDLLVALRKSKN